jgi:hypothetical protein
MQEQGLVSLWDISTWSADESWLNWHFPNCLRPLEDEKNRLLSSLQGYAPIVATTKDRRGWGSRSGLYSSAQGYLLFSEVPNVPPNPVVWKRIWHFKSLPKVDIFMWTLAHGSILSGENLEKKASLAPIGALFVALIKTHQSISSWIAHSLRKSGLWRSDLGQAR